ncbi:MAG TPA: T9SS type A sorting domain-containing protein [Chitinophagales bacterium]|nr:T9SS type A sorting domain-containing protein [Chitinophagales bacterium]
MLLSKIFATGFHPSFSITLILLLTLSSTLPAQTPDWLWTNSAGNVEEDIIRAVKPDPFGNVFAAGSFQSATLDIDGVTLVNPNGTSSDMYVSKYDGAGNLLWAKNAGGHNASVARTIATDASGNVYVAGYFTDTILFDNQMFISGGSFDMYLVKYDGSGNMVWALTGSGTGADRAYSVITHGSYVYVTGYFEAPSITIGSTVLGTTGVAAMYLVKFDNNGNVIWARSSSGPNSDNYAFSVAADAHENLYVAGHFFTATIGFDAFSLTNTDNTNTTADLYLVKYDSLGSVLWARSVAGAADDYSIGNDADASGDNYVTGYFLSDTLTAGNFDLVNAGGFDIFIIKYNNNGNVQWARNVGGNNNDFGVSVATDLAGSGDFYLCGSYASTNILFDTTLFTNQGIGDLFVAKYAGSGNLIWVKSSGGDADDEALSVATDDAANVYVGGGFASSSITFDTNTYSSAGSYDLWVGKIEDVASGTNATDLSNAGVRIFPNPCSGKFFVAGDDVKAVRVYDVMGRAVYSSLTSGESVIDTSGEPDGIYFVRVERNEELEMMKVVKE